MLLLISFLPLHLYAGKTVSSRNLPTYELKGRWWSPNKETLIVEVDKVLNGTRQAKVFFCTPTLGDEPASKEFFESGPGKLNTCIHSVAWNSASNACLISTWDCNGHMAWSSPLYLVDMSNNRVLLLDDIIGDVAGAPNVDSDGVIEVPIQVFDKQRGKNIDSIVKTSFKKLVEKSNVQKEPSIIKNK